MCVWSLLPEWEESRPLVVDKLGVRWNFDLPLFNDDGSRCTEAVASASLPPSVNVSLGDSSTRLWRAAMSWAGPDCFRSLGHMLSYRCISWLRRHHPAEPPPHPHTHHLSRPPLASVFQEKWPCHCTTVIGKSSKVSMKKIVLSIFSMLLKLKAAHSRSF